jgi:toxin FitB
MIILLDTNVISELMRPYPDQMVLAWFDAHSDSDLWTSAVVIAELLSGIDLMPVGRKERALREQVEGMIAEDFPSRILDFELEAARQYGQVVASRQRIGRPINEMDAQIAAIARVHGAILATRDTDDFLECDVPLINPWAEKQRD